MQITLTSWGSRGDVEPLAALAVQLREFGADAQVCVPPDPEFAELLARAGVRHVPMGPSVHSVVAGSKAPTAQDAFRLAPALVAARFETLLAVAGESDAIVATGLMPAGARDVAEKFGIRYVLACFHTAGLPSRRFRPGGRPTLEPQREETDLRAAWEQDTQRVNALYRESVNDHRASIGLPALDDVRGYVLGEQPWLAADPLLWPADDGTDLPLIQTGAWILPDDRPLPDDLQAFLDAGEPPVYMGIGSIAAHAPTNLARVAIEAIRSHGRRVVLSRGWAGLTPIDDGADCFTIGEVNQQALFTRVAAVIHHGGAGTTTTAAQAGAPQVIVPQIVDQPRWAARVADLGIGAAHDGPAPTVESLAAALSLALQPGTRRQAGIVAGRIRTDGAAVAAAMLCGPTGDAPPSDTD